MSIASPRVPSRGVLALAAVLAAVAVPVEHAGAARLSAGGFTTSARLSTSSAPRAAP